MCKMEEEEYEENLWSYILLCGESTLYEGLKFAKDLIIANMVLRICIQYLPLSHNIRHSLSLLIGGILLYINIGVGLMWIVYLTVASYTAIVLMSLMEDRKNGLMVSIILIATLLVCELISDFEPKTWQEIRGIQMIVAMKIISIVIDIERDLFKKILNPLEFGGYILCPANCILGPWISYHTYSHYLEVKFLTKRWLKLIITNLCISMLYLILSNCIVPWYIDDGMPKWLVAYRDAQAFRMSHYFVSRMSVVSMISAGFGLRNDCHSEIEVTKPLYIELPRSLVQVVIYWNIPMHQWLKNYVFKSCQPYGHFIAIFVTYVISSLLHGLNFQLSAVLLSIGIFSYVEYNLRSKVASALEVCCLSNPCTKQCYHKNKKYSPLAIFTNCFFSLLTLIHLAYLGVMFEASFAVQETGFSYIHTLSKWANLNYFSHGFVLFKYIVYLMI